MARAVRESRLSSSAGGAAYRGDVSGVEVWGFLQEGQAWVGVHHILKEKRTAR